MIPIYRYRLYFCLTFTIYCLGFILFSLSQAVSEDTEEIKINADEIKFTDGGNKITASGNIFVQTEEIQSSSDKFRYNKNKGEMNGSGNIIIKDKLNNYYFFNEYISDEKFITANGLDVKLRLSDGARIAGKSFSRTDSNINKINDAVYTPCLKKNYILKDCPGWKLKAKKVIHDTNKKNIYYENATLSILNIPILYTPFFSHPDPTVKKRSGLLKPSFSSDNNLGTSISIPYFYNISSNYDLTFTPTMQSKADDYYSLNYRHLTKRDSINVDTSVSFNNDTGTKNHIFIDGNVKNPFGEFNYQIQTSNNDTYLRKNNIEQENILKSGLTFSKEMEDSYLDFSTSIYKHLDNTPERKWEYIYPNANYDFYNYKDPIYGYKWNINNSLLNYRTIDKNYNQQISSEISTGDIKVSRNIGLKFENTFQTRLIYFNSSVDNFNQLRIFPQIASKISYPLSKTVGNRSEILEPIIMPILAPYNNYNNSQDVSSGNIFSLNRETSLSQWEMGPRVNYGISWIINNDNSTISSSVGQSAKINKDNSSKVSNYFIGNTFDFGSNGYISTDMTIDRELFYLKNTNINSSIEVSKFKLGFDYDYEASNKIKTSEQISVGTMINIYKDTNFILSARKDLMSRKNIGNAVGLHYENDCLAINFDYFRDFTVVKDIKNSRGFSFTITLKPFGTSKQRGKVKNFGPSL